MKNLTWISMQPNRFLVAFDEENNIIGFAQNKGKTHGPGGISDPTGQEWVGVYLLQLGEYNRSTFPTFSETREMIEEDYKMDSE